jgi:hypothetical protein
MKWSIVIALFSSVVAVTRVEPVRNFGFICDFVILLALSMQPVTGMAATAAKRLP